MKVKNLFQFFVLLALLAGLLLPQSVTLAAVMYNRDAAVKWALANNYNDGPDGKTPKHPNRPCTTYVTKALRAGGIPDLPVISNNVVLSEWLASHPSYWEVRPLNQLENGDFIFMDKTLPITIPASRKKPNDHIDHVVFVTGAGVASQWNSEMLNKPFSWWNSFSYKLGIHILTNVQPKSFNGNWYLNPNNAASDNTNLIAFQYGMSGDIPIVGDWNGDGIKTAGIFRPSNATWVLTNTNSADLTNLVSFQYGLSSDIPIVGDWNGDGIDTIGVFRPSNATWILTNTNSKKLTKLISFQYGLSSDVPIVGDWNGDGIDTVGVFRPSNATWVLTNTNSKKLTNLISCQYGLSSDIPIVGDWNGDGIDTIGVFRPSDASWSLNNTASGDLTNLIVFQYGLSSDVPVIGDWEGDGIDTVGVTR